MKSYILGLRKGNLKRETKSSRIAVQNAIKNNYIKVKIDNMQQKNKCRLFGDGDGTVNPT